MAKVFRLHKGADGTGWFSSKIFSDEDLKSILTDGKEVSSSIPSPFARIDLVKEAFRWVSANGIEGSTAQHQLVSEALDVGQLIFYSDKFKSNIDIVEYKPKTRIEQAFGNYSQKHDKLSSTLRVYWNQDSEVYNFDEADRLYFLLYNQQLIGATSPASLFFSSPITESLRQEITLTRASGTFFDRKPVSLAKRERDFVEYLYLLAKYRHFPDRFPDVYEYLQQIKQKLSAEDRRSINNLNENTLKEYEKCHVSGEITNYCEVVGITLHKAPQKTEDIESESDFVINSDFPVEGKKPLILPNDTFSESWVYTTKDVLWDPDKFNRRISNKNESSLDNSELPIQGDNYPWLTAGNFLTDTIIQLPYSIDSHNFETASQTGENKYLLPLTETYFKYFSVDSVPQMLSIEEYGQGTVVARLEVKTRGGVIKFEKKYPKPKKIELQVHLAILPFVKISQEDIPSEYTIGLLDGDPEGLGSNRFHIKGYYNGENISLSDQIVRSTGSAGRAKSYYQTSNRYFDALRLDFNHQHSGFIIPKMRIYRPSKKRGHFAIDFGTTNTHIEYKVDQNAEQPFEMSKAAPLWESLFDRTSDYDQLDFSREETFEREMMPYTLGDNDSKNSFPLRTALVEDIHNNSSGSLEVFRSANNYLLYEKIGEGQDLQLHPNLKWENLHINENLSRLKTYIEYLLRLVYYKSVSLNIDLANVNITWFYPISMSRWHRGQLEDIWTSKAEHVFREKFNPENIRKLPESVGPYYYYYAKRAITGLTVSVDIGGGSTDVSVYKEGSVKSITSFRFAGDAIFGDGYGKDPKRNGFVNLFKEKAESFLKENDIDDRVLKGILNERESSKDFSSYLFALSSSHNGFNYSDLIKNDQHIKLVIFLFHAAMAYYIAKLMHGAGYEFPKHMLFSGTAAKTVNILDSGQELNELSELYHFFFEKVYGTSNSSKINCELSEMPKELTCKGGLLADQINSKDFKKIFWLGESGNSKSIIDLDNLSESPRISEVVSEEHTNAVSSEITKFYSLIDTFSDQYNLEDYFGISRAAFRTFKSKRGENIPDQLKLGIRRSSEEQHNQDNGAEPVEETLFFYPLISEISKLGFELSKKS